MLKTRKFTWHPLYIPLIACALLQLGFWQKTCDIRPQMEVVPAAPARGMAQALTFGDDAFFFRALGLYLQNFGDLFGRFTPLKDYDFHKLSQWFVDMDALDRRSNMMPAMASYYFSQTQHTADVRYVVNYLYDHASVDVEHKWWWLVQAIYLASHKLNDMDLAMKVAAPLVNPNVPAWAQQMAAVVHEKRGEMEDAYRIMLTIKDNAKDVKDADLKYMRYFIDERLHKLDEYQQTHPDAPLPEPVKETPTAAGRAAVAPVLPSPPAGR